jgi:hypothetical protein
VYNKLCCLSIADIMSSTLREPGGGGGAERRRSLLPRARADGRGRSAYRTKFTCGGGGGRQGERESIEGSRERVSKQ